MTIWLTRPKAQSEAMADAMKRPTIVAPVQRIAHRSPVIEGMYDALITTSQHGAVGVKQFHDLPLYTVGEASAHAAREQGFTLATAMAADAVGLAAMIVSAHEKPMRFLYLSGEETRVDIKSLLESRGHHVTTVITYEAAAEAALPDALITRWNEITGVVLMSVGAVKALQSLVTKDVSHMHAFCISTTVAASAGALPWAAIHISESPTQQSLIEAIDAAISA